MGVVHQAVGCLEQAEKHWLYALELKPFYWDAIDQLTALFNSQGRQSSTAELISRIMNTSPPYTKIQNTPRDWTKYLSLYHSLGDIYCSQSHYYEAALTFSVLAAMALTLHPVNTSSLGLSAAVDKNHSESSETSFLPNLIAQISNAIRMSDADIGNHEEPDSLLFAITPRHALLCKYHLLPPHGKFPVRSNSHEWLKYQNDYNQNFSQKQKLPSGSPLDIVVSNALLNLAKIFQDGVSSGIPTRILYINGVVPTSNDILSLYMLSLSLNPSPSTANNIGILLASMTSQPSNASSALNQKAVATTLPPTPPNKPRELAIQYYNFGLALDNTNPHIYTNYGSLLREQGKLKDAILMYQKAVECDPNFNIALTNLASALRDQGQIDQTIHYYRRAVQCSPDFIEAVSGLANAQASVCDWKGRGGFGWEQVSVDATGMLKPGHVEGWVSKVVRIADQQISDARQWGIGVIENELKRRNTQPNLASDIECAFGGFVDEAQRTYWENIWSSWKGHKDEGANIVQAIEFAMRMCQRRWYLDCVNGTEKEKSHYVRPKIPSGLPIPLATTILPFHAFTLPFTASQVSQISQRSAIRISMSSLLQNWLPAHVFPPPPPPAAIPGDPVGKLVVGYISSDFLDHPLSHLMQSVFGFHDPRKFHAICYATTVSDGSEYRQKIERDSHGFKDVSGWTSERIVSEIQADGVHILVNLNGFTRGARNDIFAVRPCPIQVSLIGFAGSLGGGWCDYLLGDKHSIGERSNVDWVYRENIMYMPRSFFVCDHRQSAPDSRAQRELRAALRPGKYKSFEELEAAIVESESVQSSQSELTGDPAISYKPQIQPQPLLDDILCIPGDLTWDIEKRLRKEVRRALFPNLPATAFLMANLNQLYKIDPTTFRVWLNILERLPHAYLWLLQFPKSGEDHLRTTALQWTNNNTELVSRILFTPVADKNRHILRARACDVFLDTPECNAHTTAADVAWTGTPIVTYKRHAHKMCSRIAASIITAALPVAAASDAGDTNADAGAGNVNANTKPGIHHADPENESCKGMAQELVPSTLQGYEDQVVHFGGSVAGRARLDQIRKVLFESRESGDFFDTKKWVHHVEEGFRRAWLDWIEGANRDIHIRGG